MAATLLIALLNLYAAWRYSRSLIGPDEGHYLMGAVTGARPYVDFVDCKPPGIYLWAGVLGWLTRGNIAGIKLLHHLLLGGVPVVACALTGNLALALALTAMIQSPTWLSFQSLPDAAGAAFFALGMLLPPGWNLIPFAMALGFNLKLGLAGLVYLLWTGQWLWVLVAGGAGALALIAFYLSNREYARQVFYGAVQLPRAMMAFRKDHVVIEWRDWPTWWARSSLLGIFWLGLALLDQPRPEALLPALAYLLTNASGRVFRPNHFLPLAMLAFCFSDPWLVGLGLLMDWGSTRLLAGEAYHDAYNPVFAAELEIARRIGEALKDKPGSLFVNTYHAQIYLYARKAPYTGTTEMFEIIDSAPDLQARRNQRLESAPPALVVNGPHGRVSGGRNYTVLLQHGPFEVWG